MSITYVSKSCSSDKLTSGLVKFCSIFSLDVYCLNVSMRTSLVMKSSVFGSNLVTISTTPSSFYFANRAPTINLFFNYFNCHLSFFERTTSNLPHVRNFCIFIFFTMLCLISNSIIIFYVYIKVNKNIYY